ncbi:hypothetical protein M422DRAFT_239363 [Sphaerobolus stellatus SS14]|nr:hypothetical protein M422DRAFT_239363 [Sphaerobolus stellatus SS14]
MKTSRKEIDETLFTVDTETFFDKIIHVSDAKIEGIYKALTEEDSPVYRQGRWTNFPSKPTPGTERLFYAPFTEIATKINNIVKERDLADPGAMKGEWSTTAQTVQHTNSELEALGNQIEQLTQQQADRDNLRALEQTKKEQDKLCCLWWLLMANVLKIKCQGRPKEVEEALVQLCGYAGQIQREQLDRRFVIGCTLCFDKLNVYLFDRSGIVGTKTSINIHEQPHKFIQAIAAFSILSTEQLGWDPTMSMFCDNDKQPYASHCFPWRELVRYTSPYTIQWVVESPKDGEEFISIRSLSLIGAERMCGRATIVLEVVRLKDFLAKNSECNVFVMKQSWQRLPGMINDETSEVLLELDNSSLQSDSTPGNLRLPTSFDTTPFEDYIFKKADLEDRIYYAGYVRSNNEIVDTLQVIRKAITGVMGVELNSEGATSGYKRPRQGIDYTTREAFAFEQTLSDGRKQLALHDCHPRLASRKQTRMFMNGILHRDPSGGNVLIDITDRGNEKGFLIDLDHAKITEKWIEWKKNDEMDNEDLSTVKSGTRANEETVRNAITAVGSEWSKVIMYINTVADRNGLKRTVANPLTPEQIRWDRGTNTVPDFGGHVPGSGLRSGTFPYMSHEIIQDQPATHHAIHDIESFWWIVIHIALTRAGPGKWREGRSDDLDLVIQRYFDGSLKQLTDNKCKIFQRSYKDAQEELTSVIFKHFDAYFEPLKKPLLRWWSVLRTGFEFKGYEYHNIHALVLGILNEAICEIPDSEDELSRLEDARRKKYREGTKEAILNQKCADMFPISPKPNKMSQDPSARAIAVEPESPTNNKKRQKK